MVTLTKKNIIILHPTDDGACSWYRMRFMAGLLESGRGGEVQVLVSPFEVTDEYILKYTAAIVVSRPIDETCEGLIRRYRSKRGKFGFRIFADYDDLLFDIDGKDTMPEFNPCKLDTVETGKRMNRILEGLDGVSVSTAILQSCFRRRFKVDPVVVPNAVPSFMFGKNRDSVDDDISVPRVLYAGSLSHYGKNGDMNESWLEWLRHAVGEGLIELHVFDDGEHADMFHRDTVFHNFVGAYEFPHAASAIRPDIYLAPLVPCMFNACKSNLKLLEATALGAALLFNCWNGCPYNDAHYISGSAPRTVTNHKYMDALVRTICNRDNFNEILAHQRSVVDELGLRMESGHYIGRWLRAYFGEALRTNR